MLVLLLLTAARMLGVLLNDIVPVAPLYAPAPLYELLLFLILKKGREKEKRKEKSEAGGRGRRGGRERVKVDVGSRATLIAYM